MAEKQKRKGTFISAWEKPGRTTKYNKKYCADIVEHLSKGGSIQSFGAYIGEKYGHEYAVCRETLYLWRKKHKHFAQAIEVGLSYSQLFFEKIGNTGMVGQLKTVAKTIQRPDGSIEKIFRPSSFYEKTWQFQMKNRFGWTDKTEIDHSSKDDSMKPQVIFHIPKNGRESE